MTQAQAHAGTIRAGTLTHDQLLRQRIEFPAYATPPQAPASRFGAVVSQLWGGKLVPMMASADTGGRFGQAPLSCPPTACTGAIELAQGAKTQAWRNPEAIQCVVCIEGSLELRYGPDLARTLTLGKFDMASVPENVRLQIVNAGDGAARIVTVLSVKPQGSYDAAFDTALAEGVAADAREALGLRFDSSQGADIDTAVMEGRVTHFEQLVPYKKDLQRTGGLPAEATEKLSAGNVFPLIVPEGHIGRSRTAPMYGNQGLYISIAECRAGDDGPPPHTHSDTQESFYVLDGSFDMCSGFENETVITARPNDLVAMPNGIMRTFRNTFGKPSRLLVIIQGPDRMNDVVSFSNKIGEEFKRRFGPETIDAYEKIRMTFDAEERLSA